MARLQTIVLIASLLFGLFAMLLMHAPFYTQALYKPQRLPYPVPGYSYERGDAPVCENCVVGGNTTCSSYIKMKDTPTTWNKTCTVGDDSVCQDWAKSCDSYCSLISAGSTSGYCVNGTESCVPGADSAPFSKQCVNDPRYINDKANPFALRGETEAEQVAKAVAVMTYVMDPISGAQGAAGGSGYPVFGLLSWQLARWLWPIFLLLFLPSCPPEYKFFRFLLGAAGVFVAFINVIQLAFWCWILSCLNGSIIGLPDYDFGDRSWIFAASNLVVTGVWLFEFVSAFWFFALVRWLNREPKQDKDAEFLPLIN